MGKIECGTALMCVPRRDLNRRDAVSAMAPVLQVCIFKRHTHMQTPWCVQKWGWGDGQTDMQTPLASTDLDRQADKLQC